MRLGLSKKWTLVICLSVFGSSYEPANTASLDFVDVDQVWTGTRVGFGAVVAGDFAFVGYYNAERHMVIAKISLKTRSVQRRILPSVFDGWDSHNDVIVAVDKQNILHVFGNMHDTGLVYFRASRPLDIETLQQATMIGRDEDRMTYPRLLTDRRGNLIFFYRNGRSGGGTWFANRLEADDWRRIGDAGIFSSQYRGQSVSAYPSEIIEDNNGEFQVAIVWRDTPDVASNILLTYARTRDFVNWTTIRGRPSPAPLSAENSDVIDQPGPNAGLVNSAKLSVSTSGQPFIVYTKYTPDATNGIYVATPVSGAWAAHLVAESGRRTEIKGLGSIPGLPKFSAVQFPPTGAAVVQVDLAGGPKGIYSTDAQGDGFSKVDVSPPTENAATPPPLPAYWRDGLQDPLRMTLTPAGSKDWSVAFSWAVQSPNKDKPRDCTSKAPKACRPPPSTLKMSIESAKPSP